MRGASQGLAQGSPKCCAGPCELQQGLWTHCACPLGVRASGALPTAPTRGAGLAWSCICFPRCWDCSPRVLGALLGFVRGPPMCCPGSLTHCDGCGRRCSGFPGSCRGYGSADAGLFTVLYRFRSPLLPPTHSPGCPKHVGGALLRRCLGSPRWFFAIFPLGLHWWVGWVLAMGTGQANVFRGSLCPDILCPPLRTGDGQYSGH